MNASDHAAVLLAPPHADFADLAAAHFIARHRERLPDLSGLSLIVASPALVVPLRERLAHHAGGALLGPRISNLAAALQEHSDGPAMPAVEARLLLAHALSRHAHLFPGQTSARLADALYALFQELTQAQAPIDEDANRFEARLMRGYGATHPWLSREARIIHTLWRAFQTDTEGRDDASVQARALPRLFAQPRSDTPLTLLGFDALSAVEIAALKPALQAGRARLWTQGVSDCRSRDGVALQTLLAQLDTPVATLPGSPPADLRAELLNAAFAIADPAAADSARTRALQLRQRGPQQSVAIRLAPCANLEHEVRVLDLAVREALLAGSHSVVVVSEDRRLARRLRALLERAGVSLDDRAGWALATSRAASALAAWLDCVHDDFPYRALLALLKCGFWPTDAAAEADAAWLERTLIYRRDLPVISGLQRFRDAADAAGRADIARRLDHLARAAQFLPVAAEGARLSSGLLKSLGALGLELAFENDEAGAPLLAQLRGLDEALRGLRAPLHWRDFRSFLERLLEESTFRPSLRAGARAVRLYTLAQTPGLRADLVIVAGASATKLPGAPAGEAFFNGAVRAELGLPTAATRRALTLARLRTVLESAPQVLVTYAAEEPGDAPRPSPWLTALAAFATAAGLPSLFDHELPRRAGDADTDIAVDSVLPLPAQQAAPAAAPALLSWQLSAGAHQSLIDCPYQFHARAALRLNAEPEPDKSADRSDYGNRVHRILAAFHRADLGLPAPYFDALDAAHAEAIAAKLRELATAVFRDDLAQRPLARAWTRDFEALVPWLSEQLIAAGNTGVEVETAQEAKAGRWQLNGKLDRWQPGAEQGDGRVVDYKTGRAVPKLPELQRGEAVQLPHYALLVGAARADYWHLPEKKIISLNADALGELVPALWARLQTLGDALAEHTPLPANGIEDSCQHCDFSGLCRRDSWQHPTP